jgi:hypothetical protein
MSLLACEADSAQNKPLSAPKRKKQADFQEDRCGLTKKNEAELTTKEAEQEPLLMLAPIKSQFTSRKCFH